MEKETKYTRASRFIYQIHVAIDPGIDKHSSIVYSINCVSSLLCVCFDGCWRSVKKGAWTHQTDSENLWSPCIYHTIIWAFSMGTRRAWRTRISVYKTRCVILIATGRFGRDPTLSSSRISRASCSRDSRNNTCRTTTYYAHDYYVQ